MSRADPSLPGFRPVPSQQHRALYRKVDPPVAPGGASSVHGAVGERSPLEALGPEKLLAADLCSAEVGLVQLGPVQIGLAEISLVELGATQIALGQIGTTVWRHPGWPFAHRLW